MMSMLANMPPNTDPCIHVDPRFVSEVQAYRYWKRSRGRGWRIRISHETVFNLPLIGSNGAGRLVAFYLVDYGPEQAKVSEEYEGVLFTMPIEAFLFEYEPEYPREGMVKSGGL